MEREKLLSQVVFDFALNSVMEHEWVRPSDEPARRHAVPPSEQTPREKTTVIRHGDWVAEYTYTPVDGEPLRVSGPLGKTRGATFRLLAYEFGFHIYNENPDNVYFHTNNAQGQLVKVGDNAWESMLLVEKPPLRCVITTMNDILRRKVILEAPIIRRKRIIRNMMITICLLLLGAACQLGEPKSQARPGQRTNMAFVDWTGYAAITLFIQAIFQWMLNF